MFDCFKPKRSEPKGAEEDTVPKEVMAVYAAYRESDDFSDPRYIAQFDLKINSRYPRFFIYDTHKKVLHSFKVAHGSGRNGPKPHWKRMPSDGRCREVSNEKNCYLSSKGLYRCGETYNGKYGRSLKLYGLEESNSNAWSRAIVLHSSKYVTDGNEHICGMSWGCPAVSEKNKDKIVDMLKDGSPMLMVI